MVNIDLEATQLRQWLSTLGYTICFAVILAKTWRVYLIFTNPHQKKKVCLYIYFVDSLKFSVQGTQGLDSVTLCGDSNFS